jgi:L-ascorbate metabolism protein UlaG (beta-lactamase superfamily)
MLNIYYHGHSCFRLKDDTYDIIIDPFLNGNPLADVKAQDVNPTHILLTHGHGDHLGDALSIAKRTGALIIAPNELAAYCQGQGAKVHPMHIGGSWEFPFGKVKLTPAWHGSAVVNGSNIIYTGTPCGFLIKIQDKLIYHAGDTGLFGDMKLIGERNKIDYALLPIGDNYVMGTEDAVYAASLLKGELTIPMHYNTFPLVAQDPQNFVNKLKEIGLKGKVMQPGEKISVINTIFDKE